VVILAAGIAALLTNVRSFKLQNPSYELLAAMLIQWLYKTLTTGDAIDYAKYLAVIAFWCTLGIHLVTGENCKES
jgi:ABC-type sugar transport system permease subunit